MEKKSKLRINKRGAEREGRGEKTDGTKRKRSRKEELQSSRKKKGR